jgi:predicted ribosomally synthesized six-cysteine peptide SCIFF
MFSFSKKGGIIMGDKVHIKTINKEVLTQTLKNGGCGECVTSCQSACKTSCTVSNQSCLKK